MLNEISTVLLAIAGISASFVAILGGFIASRLISINSERDAAKSRLKEIGHEKILQTEMHDTLRRILDEEGAICYIHNHMEDMVEGADLEDVYEENERQFIEYETLLPYWKKAQVYMDLFDEHLEKENPQFNVDYIPSELAESHRDDLFAYEFFKMYAGWGFGDYFENCEPLAPREWCKEKRQEIAQISVRIVSLDIQECRYSMDLEHLKKPRGMKVGLVIFALFSVFNIIVPLVLSSVSLLHEYAAIILYCSIGTLALGLAVTFFYLAWLLRWKE